MALSATTPYPYPNEIIVSLSAVIFLEVAKRVKPASGSAPAERMKINGVLQSVSWKTSSIVAGLLEVNFFPKTAST